VAGRTAPPWSLRRCRVGDFGPSFDDLTIGAHQLALILVPCQAAEPTPTNLRPPEHGSMARTGAPGALRDRCVGGFGSKTVDSGSLAVSHHRLRRSPLHMIVPVSTARFVFSGALIDVQPLESVAFFSSFSWHPGVTGWQVSCGRCAMVSFWTWQ
jgi:hypothetical protein